MDDFFSVGDCCEEEKLREKNGWSCVLSILIDLVIVDASFFTVNN